MGQDLGVLTSRALGAGGQVCSCHTSAAEAPWDSSRQGASSPGLSEGPALTAGLENRR